MGKKKGGKIIGEGLSGVVHYPALECANPAETPKGDYVTKVVRKAYEKSGEEEYRKTAALRDLDIGIFPEHICRGPKGELLLYSKYGGNALIDFGLPDALYEPDKEKFDEIKDALIVLREKVKKFNAAGFYHNDISFDNVVYNPDTKVAYLIDFERMTTGSFKNRDENNKHEHPYVLARLKKINQVGPDIAAMDSMLESFNA